MTTPEHTISALCQRSRDISLEKGWLNPDGSDPRPYYTVIGLFHSELSEAFEETRAHKKLDEVWYEVGGMTISKAERERSVEPPAGDIGAFKPCGIPIEFADFVIRVCQWVGSAGVTPRFAAYMEELTRLAQAESIAIEDAEALIAQLHTDVSMSLVAVQFKNAGNNVDLRAIGLPADPLNYLAAAVHSLFRYCEKEGVDLWAAIDEKEAFNRTRPIRHGGKKS